MRFKYYLRGAGIGVIVATLILSIAFIFQDHISDEEVIRRAIELGMVMEGEEGTTGTLADMRQPGTSSVDLETVADDVPNGTGNGDGTTTPENSGSSDPVPEQDTLPDTDAEPSKDSDQDTDKDSGKDKDKNEDKNEDKDKNQDSNKDKNQNSNKDKDTDSGTTDNSPNSNKPGSRPSGTTENTATITIEAGDVSRIVSAKVFEAGLVDSADEFNSYLGEHGYANLLQPGTYEINKDATFRQIAIILTTRQ